jgi:predicted nucleotidyltransferase
MPSDSTIPASIENLGQTLAQALGTNLACLAVYGSAADETFRPEHSDINLLVVLHKVQFADLELIGELLRKQATPTFRLATPLVIAPSFLRDARDSFPIELADIARRHRMLAGEDLVSGIQVTPTRLRDEAEREARGKLLRLRALIMHRPAVTEIREGLMGLLSSFTVIERDLMQEEASGLDLLERIEARQSLRLTSLRKLQKIRDGAQAWPEEAFLHDLLRDTASEVESLVQWVDQHES